MSSRLLTGAAIEGRRAVRGLVHSPGFSVGVVLVLGIAIAGMVTMTTVAYDLFLKPLPFPRAEQLVQVDLHSRAFGMDVGFAPPMLPEIRQEPMVTGVAAYRFEAALESEQGEDWRAGAVTPNLADVLGVHPVAGRAFAPADGEPGAPAVALIAERTWRARFAADATVIGRDLVLGDRRLRIVGVMPAAFSLPTAQTEIWYPLSFTPEELARSTSMQGISGRLVARLAPGHTARQLEDALRARRAADGRPAPGSAEAVAGLEPVVTGLREAWTAEQRQPVAIIGFASLLVFAAALFNVAGLWLARLLARSHEQAIQAALGAGGLRRLARTGFEFLLLGAAGACAALALIAPALRWLEELRVLNPGEPLAVRTGPATLVIVLLVLAASSVPVLVAAAWQQRQQRRELLTGLGGGRAAGGAGRGRRVLIVGQVALAMSVLCAMGLLLRSWGALLTEDLGFEPQDLLVARISAEHAQPHTADPAVAAALDAVRGLPGVTAVAHTSVAPFSYTYTVTAIEEPGSDGKEARVFMRRVSERYFEVIGIPVVEGRPFEPGDTGVIVDRYLADRYFPGGAVGELLRFPADPGQDNASDAEIIGVAGTAKHHRPDEEPNQGAVYLLRSAPLATATVVVSTTVPPAGLADEVRAALARVLGPERVGDIDTMERLVRLSVRDREPQLVLLGIFAAEALALAGIGLFSLLAYSARARTAEFGVRQAVGAQPADIRRHVLGDAARLLAAGLVIGLGGAWLAGRALASRLYEVSPVDPFTWLATGCVLVLVVLAAGFWPAERAARIEPTEALRHE